MTAEELIYREQPCGNKENPECKRCADSGMVYCFDSRHNQGWFAVFCNCNTGKYVEEEMNTISQTTGEI